MKNILRKTCYSVIKVLFILVMGLFFFTSCKNDYVYDQKEPDFLGSSIYQYLADDGNFSVFLKLIDELGYKDVFNYTGSKTLFVASDSSFTEFFKNNPWGVSSYENLTLQQKKMLLKYCMINNAYLIGTMSNYSMGNLYYEGGAMRRITELDPIDILSFDKGDAVSTGKFWDYYRDKGIYLLKDNSSIPFVFFSQGFLTKNSITDDDFSFISGGITRQAGDFYLFNNKVIQRDIVCKNGYIHVLKSVLIPPTNMAEYIATNSKTKIFSKLLDRFSLPVYDAANTQLYRQLNPGFNDSIFIKAYTGTNGGWNGSFNGQALIYQLPYNPGWNAYSAGYIYPDMAAMFVPTDDAMNDYLNNSPTGLLLKERYGSWDSIPDEIALSFVKRHMRTSFVESLPSRFGKMVDDQNYALPVQKSDIEVDGDYTAVNGQVYMTNRVYVPLDFVSVYAPVLWNRNAKIMNWAISRTVIEQGVEFAFYKLYLNSLVVKYGLFIPVDNYFDAYREKYLIDPVTYGQTGVQGVLKYWYNDRTSSVNATVYTYSKATGVVGDSVAVITDASFLTNRLWKILDSHIVVGDVSGDGYYVTKANDVIKVSDNGTKIQGGYDMDKGTFANVQTVYHQENGTTYLIDAPIRPALQSTYGAIGDAVDHPEFTSFFELLNGIPDDLSSSIPYIFVAQGVDEGIRFFNAYNYTIYVPSNEAIQKAVDAGVFKTWDQINLLPAAERLAEATKLVRILRYHFQDNSLFVGQDVNVVNQSAALKLATDNSPVYWGTTDNKYYKLGVKSVTGSNGQPTLAITTELGPQGTDRKPQAEVIAQPGYYNIVVKDYVFPKLPSQYKNVDGTGSATAAAFSTSSIITSSSAVIHLIDNVLTFGK